MKSSLFQILILIMENTPEAEKVEAVKEDNQLENPEVNKAEADQEDNQLENPEVNKAEADQEDNQLENPEVNKAKAEADQKDLSQPVKPEELTLEQQPSEVENHVHEGGFIAC